MSTGNGFVGTNAYDALMLRRHYGKGKLKNMSREYSNFLNNLEYRREVDHIRLLFSARFRWNVKELNISNEYVEQRLFYNAFMALYKDSSLGWLLLPASPIEWNAYMEPTKLLIQGYNYNKTVPYSVDSEDVVLLYDNNLFLAPCIEFMRYASLISDVGRSCEVYANAMKKPLHFVTDVDNKKNAEYVFDSITQNDSYVMYNAKMFPRDEMGNLLIEQFKTDHNAQDLKGLDMYKHSLYDEMLGRLGIATTPIRKQAQQTEDEINKNDEMCRIVLNQATECREKSVERMREISGLNITCELVDDISLDDWEGNENGVIKPKDGDNAND